MRPSAATITRLVAAVAIVLACAPRTPAQPAANPAPPNFIPSTAGDLRVERLTTLEYPWGLAFLPDGRLLITEKPGRLRIWADGKLSDPVAGVPKVVHRNPRDQGGLLDVEADPDFANNKLVYLSFAEAAEQQPPDIADTDDVRFGRLDLTDNILRGGAVARARLEGTELRDLQVIWRQYPKTVGRGHFGNRLVFDKDGKLFITSADRMRFEPAQNLNSNLGKVCRINPDGSIPQDNPFVGKEGARGDIWSYGHRNALSAAIDPSTRKLWIVEMGPLGGDELNLVQPGKNYGWPIVSDGNHYGRPGIPTSLTTISGHATSKEFQAPVRSFTPVISPSGAAFYTGDLIPQWRNSLFVGGLSSTALIRFAFDGDRVAVEERLHMARRIRDVIQAPDGALLVIVDAAQGDLLRLTPAKAASTPTPR